ncbi:hypothetical protein FLAG1_05828 [Fusarium langsethiae]|uniref:Uncharacterized protein n=1 Tax=Fusarium langsethiae TaxID=179993 RepID=A0A0M9EWD0_FUSLA|nr:hypothetical protein FLAG1_05828 [Fusarium langsethiae]
MRQSKDDEEQTERLSDRSSSSSTSAASSPRSSSPYELLNRNRDCTRVLRIEAAKDDDPITCTLSEVAFSDRPKFDALSYMWGDEKAEHKITVNGVSYSVRQNLWDALHYLRRHAPGIDYWIDAICINQKDVDERSRQVRMMHHIYFRAQTVVVWLGKGYAEYETALPDLKALQHHMPSDQQATPGEPADAARNSPAERSLAEKLYKDNYWKRLWIIQEIAHAQKIRVCFGNSVTDWNLFTHFMVMHNFGSDGPIKLERQRVEKYTGSNTLLGLFQKYTEAECQDRKDKVYGLVGMASDARGFLIDYKKSPFEIWTDVMEFMNQHKLFYGKDILYVGHLVKFLLMGEECDPLQQIMRPYAPREGDATDMEDYEPFRLEAAILGCVISVGPQPHEIVGNLKTVDSWIEQIQANYKSDLGNAHRDNDRMIRTILELDDEILSMKCFDCRSTIIWDGPPRFMGNWIRELRNRSCGSDGNANSTSEHNTGNNSRLFQISLENPTPWKLGLASSDLEVGDVICWFGWPRRAVVVRAYDQGRAWKFQVVGTAVVAEDLREPRLDHSQRSDWYRDKKELTTFLDARTIFLCAITTEYVAAQEFLDEEHEGPDYVSHNDNNHYTLGRIGRHNVVMAVLPDNEYGKSSAAGVARDMMHSFPNVRIGLMVGIGGGAPGKYDIRLGDVVVSSGTNNGGVLGYDFGKDIQGKDFQVTGFLNQPPTLLRTAMSGLRAHYERRGHQLSETVNTILEKNKRLRRKYKQPETASDQLYKSEVTHDSSCTAICCYDEANLVLRPERDEDEDYPVIHYGLIASADKLMKNALTRDKLSEEHDVLCFEMEAAGLLNHFPCLVIRGICDYSDSHKNKAWQGYAAMVAAAYAKDLLYEIAPNRVEAEKTVGDILSGLQEVVQEQCDIAKQQFQSQEEREKERREQKCHQLFRLTTGSRDATYEWYKDRVEDRVQDTCMWFLEHKNFQTWLNQETGPLLVSADPGCGKSVLAKYLIDHGLPRSSTICYFFFKDQDQNTVRQALCALIHQLFSLKPFLIEHAMSRFRMNGQGLINSTDSLWEILQSAVQDPRASSIIIVLDALDECADSEFLDLMRNVRRQFHRRNSGYGKLRYLLTCRPYDQILSRFQALLRAFPNIHIPGEEKSEAISQEVNHVIKCRIDQMAIERQLPPQVKSSLEQRLQNTSHRTYLWVYLVFDYLAEGNFKKTPKGITSAIASLPRSVNEAYEQILNKTNQDPMVRKALCIILAASRPLTLSEMNVAVNLDNKVDSLDDIDLEDDEDFKARLRSWSREFLLADLGLRTAADAINTKCVDQNSFLNYSAKSWAQHFCKAAITDGATIVPSVRRLCDTRSKGFSVWFNIYRYKKDMVPPRDCDDLVIASYLGHLVIVKVLLQEGVEIEAKDTSLLWAALEGHEAVVKLLLERGADINLTGRYGRQTPLYVAAEHGHKAVVELLLEKGADVNTKSGRNLKTPVHIAALKGHNAITKLLIENGADTEDKDDKDWTPLYAAIDEGHETTVKLLLGAGADVNYESAYGTPWLVAKTPGVNIGDP